MHDDEEAIQFNIPNDWMRLTRPRSIYRWLEHRVISVSESEFLENIEENFPQFVSQKQAKWLRDIHARVFVFELQHSLDVPDRDDLDCWVNEANQSSQSKPGYQAKPRHELRRVAEAAGQVNIAFRTRVLAAKDICEFDSSQD